MLWKSMYKAFIETFVCEGREQRVIFRWVWTMLYYTRRRKTQTLLRLYPFVPVECFVIVALEV